jgi:uncharacterized protein YjbI with pentapeptide repeats
MANTPAPSKRPAWLPYGFLVLLLLAMALIGIGLSKPGKPTVPKIHLTMHRVVRFLTNHQVALLAGVVILALFFLLIVREAYIQRWEWTGFAPSASDQKTLWDWLQLLGVLAIPLVVAVGGFLFTQQQQQQANMASTAQHNSDAALALDQTREDLLNTYMDRMTDLLLATTPGQLPLDQPDSSTESRTDARVRTLDVLGQLDGNRKGQLLRFLYEAHLITDTDIISLSGADLTGANLSWTYLTGANLIEANLTGANLIKVHLAGAHLEMATMTRAYLNGADLRGANMSLAGLSGADLRGANMSLAGLRRVNPDNTTPTKKNRISVANLSLAILRWALHMEDLLLTVRGSVANLSLADLRGANLAGANLAGAILLNADLRCQPLPHGKKVCTNLAGANLAGANLRGARGITDAQVEQETPYLSGTILPSGKVHS